MAAILTAPINAGAQLIGLISSGVSTAYNGVKATVNSAYASYKGLSMVAKIATGVPTVAAAGFGSYKLAKTLQARRSSGTTPGGPETPASVANMPVVVNKIDDDATTSRDGQTPSASAQ